MQINSINNNSNPSFGMSLRKFPTENQARQVLDIFTMASKGLRETAKDVNLRVSHFGIDQNNNCYIDVIASTLQKNIFQKLFKKPEEIVQSEVILGEEWGNEVPRIAAKLEEVGKKARQTFFDESIEIGKQKLEKAMKPERRMTDSTGPDSVSSMKKYPPFMGDKTASIKAPENIVKKKTKELQDPELRTGPLPWHGKR